MNQLFAVSSLEPELRTDRSYAARFHCAAPAAFSFGTGNPLQAASLRVEGAIAELKVRLLNLRSAENAFGFSRTAFWRFRKRHRIRLLPNGRVCIDDVFAGLEAERRGQRRIA
jgi:hypothetical protein